MSIDDTRRLGRRDRHRVDEMLASFPAQCRAALALGATPAVPGERPTFVVVAGMGGSAAGGDLLAACAADRVDVPVVVHRGYGLPAAAGGSALVIASSYSGETDEVLSAAEAALERGVRLVAVTSGGRLAALALERGLPLLRLPAGLAPRLALGYLSLPLVRLLGGLGLVAASEAELGEAVVVLETLASELAPQGPAATNEAKRVAAALEGRMPAIYGGPTTGTVAYRWKTDLEENAKLLAVAGTVPEMNHNEIEAWREPGARAFAPVFLRDADEPTTIARRFEVLRELIGPAVDGVSECWARGAGRPARLLSLAYLGMWVSYYLAVSRGVDPWSVPLLDELKRRLR